MKKDIRLRNIRMIGDMELTLKIKNVDYEKLRRLTKSQYKLTILEDKGYKPLFRKIFSNKVALVGLVLFLFLIYYQSLFISEIRVSGYESFTEARIRESLKEAGFYEGCRKNIDINEVKNSVNNDLGNIVWIGITYQGSLAEVKIVEGTINLTPLDRSRPCHIVADKAGYIEEVIPLQGLRALEQGVYVQPGDVLISGMIPMASTAYGTPTEHVTERYVHAEGTVTAKVPDRFVYYQNRYELIKTKTGSRIFGIEICLGDKRINTAKFMNSYEVAEYKTIMSVSAIRPLPIRITFLTIEEVTLSRRERTEEEILKLAETQLRAIIKEKLPEKAEITNKSLNFVPGENIIEVSAMIESLQQIGTEQEIVIGNTENESQ